MAFNVSLTASWPSVSQQLGFICAGLTVPERVQASTHPSKGIHPCGSVETRVKKPRQLAAHTKNPQMDDKQEDAGPSRPCSHIPNERHMWPCFISPRLVCFTPILTRALKTVCWDGNHQCRPAVATACKNTVFRLKATEKYNYTRVQTLFCTICP